MKKVVSLIAFVLGISAFSSLHAQNTTTLRFTGQGSDGAYVQLNRVEVKNLTRGWEETLVYPDTILMLGGVGIEDHVSVSRFALSQNTPNPFRGSSDFSLQLPDNEKVNVTVYDLNGKRITDITQDLPAGIHVFRVILNTPQTYLVTASTEHHSASIKIINQGSEVANRLVYLGMSSGLIQYELGGTKNVLSDHEFEQGDLMCYVGKYLANDVEYTSDTILQPQYGSQDFQLVFHCVPLNFSMFNATTCGVFTWNGQTYTQSGDYVQTFQGANGCDSVVTLHLTVNQPITYSFEASACGNYVWNGQTYTQSGTYTQTFQAVNGCDSVVTLNLTMSNSVTSTYAVNTCGSYTWNGATYSQSGVYTQTFQGTNGCDSVVTLHLTVNQPITYSFEASACGNYVWNGQTYTQTGTYTQTFTAANGCDSVVTLNLTVNQPVPHSFAASSCGSYVWNGQTYTQSGDYVQTFQGANGCDSVVTLHLTVNQPITYSFEASTCGNYVWNGQTYTQLGTYTQTLTAANGCDSVATLHLTVNQPVTNSIAATTCGSYMWNGQTYTQTGTYTQTLQTANGCDSVVTLHLTVNQPVTNSISVTACGSYMWNGQTYTQSGSYTQTLQAANGCDSVATLHLTVNQPVTNSIAATTCGSYMWNGQTYTQSGTYTQTLTAANGCDSVVTLHLTVNQPVTNSISATACGGYVWNGQTYVQSGTYTQTLTAANGCDSVVTLHLTVNQPVTHSFAASSCGSYMWNGQTYTQSGTYTQTLTAANGCDSVVTLNLTIEAVSIPVLSEVQVYGVSAHTANVMASVQSDGCSTVLSQGFCWGTQPNPVVTGSHVDCPTGMAMFFNALSGLEAGQTYYVRAYATNAAGTGYSTQATFTTDSYLSFALLVDTPCTSDSVPVSHSTEVLEYCVGTDSVRLSIANYEYGIVQWQVSHDTVEWTNIKDANDTFYVFYPEESGYYRARMTYNQCPSEYSQTIHLHLIPRVDAGRDRVLNADQPAQLFGNEFEDATGLWTVLSGDSAAIDDPTDPYALFQGSDSLYVLTWTLTNSCGSSTDTVTLRFIHTVLADHIVVVDTTDLILSDSAEIANGIYRIVFNYPVPTIVDSTILVGIPNGGFLRKVMAFEQMGDTVEMYTIQATLDDLIEEGAFNFDGSVLQTGGNSPSKGPKTVDGYVRLDHQPTRAELMENPDFQNGSKWCYEYPMELGFSDGSKSIVRNFSWPIVKNDALSIMPKFSISEISITPAVTPVFDFYKSNGMYYASFSNKAQILFSFKATLDASISGTYTIGSDTLDKQAEWSKTLTEIVQRYICPVGAVPVEIAIKFEVKFDLDASATITAQKTWKVSGALEYDQDLQYDNGNVSSSSSKSLKNFKVEDLSVVPVDGNAPNINIGFELATSLKAKVSLDVYEVLGPYAEIGAKLSLKSCASVNPYTPSFGSISSELSFDIPWKLGLAMKVLKKKVFDINLKGKIPILKLKDPSRLERNVVPLQFYNCGNGVYHPGSFKVIGGPVSFFTKNKVHIQSSSGYIASSMYGNPGNHLWNKTVIDTLINSGSDFNIYWKPNGSTSSNIKVEIKDCEGEDIDYSPMIFPATTGTSSCLNSTLQLTVVGGELRASGGSTSASTPYFYSSDGTSFSQTKPTPLPGHTYYVRDANNCVAQCHIPEQVCNLQLTYQMNGTTVVAQAENGTPPYRFYLDGSSTPFAIGNSPTATVASLSYDDHTIRVRDHKGCWATAQFTVTDGTYPPMLYVNPAYNSYKNIYTEVMSVVFDDGNLDVTERGIYYSTNQNMTPSTKVVGPLGNGMGPYLCSIPANIAQNPYYVCAYAVNSKGGTGYSDTVLISRQNSNPSQDGQPCPGTPTVTDHEGNVYATVQIGNQCWMRDNLRTTTSPSTGTYLIPAAGTDYTYTGKQAFWYNNDSATYAPMNYGLLYNWNAAVDTFNTAYGETSVNTSYSNAVYVTFSGHRRGICPAGWHLPSNAEWTQMENYVSSQSEYTCGGDSSYIAKALASTEYWNSYSGECYPGDQSQHPNNSTGFSAVPAGVGSVGLFGNVSSFFDVGYTAGFWSSSQHVGSPFYAYSRQLLYRYAYVDSDFYYKFDGYSVRCLRDENNTGGTAVVDEKSCPGTPTVTDHEGNVYATVQIGNQCWMRDNLRTTTSPSTGTYLIPAAGTVYTYTGKQARWYNNDSATYAPMNYGLLYNWNAAVDTFTTAYGETSVNVDNYCAESVSFTSHRRGICPAGWHLPSDAEWTQLTNYVSSQSEYTCDSNSNYIAKALASTEGWSYSDECCPGDQSVTANSATGFSAVPAGCYGSSFDRDGAYFWCVTQNYSSNNAYNRYTAFYRRLYNHSAVVSRYVSRKRYGFSVRCLRDTGTVGGGGVASLPSVITSTVSSISVSSAICGGNVTSDGGSVVMERGVCWSTTPSPTVANDHTTDGIGVGVFSSSIVGLSEGVTYYVRAYATNSVGTVYGDEVSFVAENTVPATGGDTIVTCDSWIYDNGGSTGDYQNSSDGYLVVNPVTEGQEVVLEGTYTVESSYDHIYIYSGEGISGTLLGDYTGSGSIYLTNNGTVTIRFTSDVSVVKSGFAIHVTCDGVEPPIGEPTVITNSVSDVTDSSATCGGNVTSDGGDSVTTRGVCWSTSPNPTIADNHTIDGGGTGSFTSSITGLNSGTTYYVRAYATNSLGTAYGEEVSFTTAVITPTEFTCGISTVTDHEGNEYHTVSIGSQCWTRENMRCVTSPSTGTYLIPSTSADYTWTGKQARWYDNDSASYAPMNYGLLYNWNAAVDTFNTSYGETSVDTNRTHAFSVTFNGHRRGICPEGWHVPTDAEWTALTNYLSSQSQYTCGGSNEYIVNALASIGGWNSCHLNCTAGFGSSSNNASCFSALPASFYAYEFNETGETSLYFGEIGETTFFWSASQQDGENAWERYIEYCTPFVNREADSKVYGNSVRCIYDSETYSSVSLPAVSTSVVTVLSETTAECGGEVLSDGGATVTARGVCWSTVQNPTISDNHTTDGGGIGVFVSSIEGLSGVSTYYVRAYATNGVGTVYGNEVSFITVPYPEVQPCPNTPIVTDYDGNVYNTVQIGSQCWLKENLRAIHYSNGDAISEVVLNPHTGGGGVIIGGDFGACLFHVNNDSSNDTIYGLLYNWRATMGTSDTSSSNPSGVQGICPNGWHVPSVAEWTQLVNFVSGNSQYLCGLNNTNTAKSLAGQEGWVSSAGICAVGNNIEANNATGFSAIPAGYASTNEPGIGSYNEFGEKAGFWSTESFFCEDCGPHWNIFPHSCCLNMNYDNPRAEIQESSNNCGLSVRCLRDIPISGGDTTYLFQEGFESGSLPNGWTTVDSDGDGNNWYVTNGVVHAGDGCVTSASWKNTVLIPDNWLISPAVELSGDATLSFWVAGQDPNYAAEHFSVYLSTTGTAISDFTTTLLYDQVSTPTMTQYTVDLSPYSGQTVYIAFRHHNITDMFRLNLDDVEIYTYSTGGSTGGGTPGENGNPDNIVDGEYGAP